jgi:hypothetical protein
MAGRSGQVLNPPNVHFKILLIADVVAAHPCIPFLIFTLDPLMARGTVRQAGSFEFVK